MCQSAKTSLVAWIVATVIAMIILTTGKKNAKWNAFFILTFIAIQLLEFFIWHFRKSEQLSASADEARRLGCNSEKNRHSGDVMVRLILIGLWLQPLVQTYMAYKYGSGYKPQLMVITIVYFVMVLWSITQAMDRNAEFRAQPVVCAENANGHLTWSRSNSPNGFVGPGPAGYLYVFGLFFGLLFMTPKLFGIMLTLVGGAMVAYTSKTYAKGEFASMWCLFALFYAIVAYMMAYSRRAQV
jgi:hypothetical protein